MHIIYLEQGKFNFIYQIPQILYSFIITSIVNTIINYLSLTEKKVIKLKSQQNDINKKYENILKCIKIKFIFFYVLIFIILIFFWYYIACFCAVYRNTQVHLIKDTLISFVL
jgi:hypothetical protein